MNLNENFAYIEKPDRIFSPTFVVVDTFSGLFLHQSIFLFRI